MMSKITRIFTAFAVSSALTTSAIADDRDTAPFTYLVEAVVKLKAKTIPQAYFWLGSPQVPDSTIFTPDTKKGGFVMIVKKARLADHSERVFYSDNDWNHLVASVKKWTVWKSEIAGAAYANQWKVEDDEILVLRIPDDHKEFLAALLKGWRTNETDFRCGIHWN